LRRATQIAESAAEAELADEVRQCYADPERFVLVMYPWGEPGPLQDYEGPDDWQRSKLRKLGRAVAERGFDGNTPVQAIRDATSSGHGIGKSTLVAWIVD
jgi:hypothetical protein